MQSGYYDHLPFQPGINALQWLSQACAAKKGTSSAFQLTGVRIPPTVCLSATGDAVTLVTDELPLDSPECIALAAKDTELGRIEQLEGGTSAGAGSAALSSSSSITSRSSARGIRTATLAPGPAPSMANDIDSDEDDNDAFHIGVRLPGSSTVYATSSSCVSDRP